MMAHMKSEIATINACLKVVKAKGKYMLIGQYLDEIVRELENMKRLSRRKTCACRRI